MSDIYCFVRLRLEYRINTLLAFFMNITKVGRRGQISIPRNIRQTLNLQEGDRLAFIQRGNEVVLQPLHQTLADFRGGVPVSKPQDLNTIRQEVFNTESYRTTDS